MTLEIFPSIGGKFGQEAWELEPDPAVSMGSLASHLSFTPFQPCCFSNKDDSCPKVAYSLSGFTACPLPGKLWTPSQWVMITKSQAVIQGDEGRLQEYKPGHEQ